MKSAFRQTDETLYLGGGWIPISYILYVLEKNPDSCQNNIGSKTGKTRRQINQLTDIIIVDLHDPQSD